MRKLSEGEVLSLTALLNMENDGLVMARAIENLISDAELKKLANTAVISSETRIKGIQQFINENHVTETGGVR